MEKSNFIILRQLVRRRLATALHRAAHEGGPVLLEGPRGAGKTWLLKHEFPRLRYVSLNDARDRNAARSDPAALIARLRGGAIIDDVERAPELAAYGAGVALGGPLIFASARALGLPVATLRLYHPTRAELEGRAPLPFEMLGHFTPVAREGATPRRVVWPDSRGLDERDLRGLVSVRDLDCFERFVEAARGVSGQVLDVQRLARLCGISRTTAVRWLAVLDACMLTIRVRPSDYDFGRRVVRSPKLHFLEGGGFESAVVSEIYRNAAHGGDVPDLRYWRDSNGVEVALVRQGRGSPPAPVSIVESPDPADFVRLQRWMTLAGVRAGAMVSQRAGEPRRGVLRYGLEQL